MFEKKKNYKFIFFSYKDKSLKIIIIAKIKTIIANLLTKMSDSECIISIKNIDGYEESETKDSSPVEVSQLSQELKQSPQKNHQNSLEILKKLEIVKEIK